MKISHLFALAAVAGVAGQAGAQESRVRISTPGSFSYAFGEPEHRAALGISTGVSGTSRDTLGLLVQAVTKGSPAERAGIEEGNRIAAINNVSLRVAAADLEDNDMSGALVRRLTRELGKMKPGDDVDVRVYRDGKFQNLKIRTADSDSLFRRADVYRTSDDLRKERENHGAIGVVPGSTGSRRDTLGVLVMSVLDSSPALRAGIEEGNRIAAINGVNLRVPKDDAGDRYLSTSKVERLTREIAQVKPGDDVKLTVYGNGRFRDVTVKAVRAADLARSGSYTIFGAGDFAPLMRAMPSMPAMPDMPRMMMTMPSAPRTPMPDRVLRINTEPMVRANMERARVRLEELRPMLERVRVAPRVRVDIDA